MAITNETELGTYINRYGRKVRMKRGTMGGTTVFFYRRAGRPIFVSADELRSDWSHERGNHVFGSASGCQGDFLGWSEFSKGK